MEKKHVDFLGVIQSGFPVTTRPFRDVAGWIGWTEQEVIDTLRSLIDRKIVRAFGPVFDPKKLGYKSTLVAAEVNSDKVDKLAAAMLDIREITHNYLRENKLNLWFTIIARSEEIIENIAKRVEKFPGVKRVLNLPVVTVFKINAVFGIDKKNNHYTGITGDYCQPLSELEKRIVIAVQDDFPLVERPFQVIADLTDTVESEVIEIINSWLNDGVLRRFGARLNHRTIGYSSNKLAAWEGEHIDLWGKKFAELAEISHCYRRKPHHDWPYELYTMIHTKTEKEMDDVLKKMKTTAHGAGMVSLKTQSELKKTSMKYFLEPW